MKTMNHHKHLQKVVFHSSYLHGCLRVGCTCMYVHVVRTLSCISQKLWHLCLASAQKITTLRGPKVFHLGTAARPPPLFFNHLYFMNWQIYLNAVSRSGRGDGWAERGGGGGLVSGVLASEFTAYISHILLVKERGPPRKTERGLGEEGACVRAPCMSIRMC